MLTWARHLKGGAPTHPEGKPMPYVILKPTFAGGARRNAGDVVDIAEDEARNLLAMGRIDVAAPPPKAEVQDRSVGLQASTTAAPKKRVRKAKDAD